MLHVLAVSLFCWDLRDCLAENSTKKFDFWIVSIVRRMCVARTHEESEKSRVAEAEWAGLGKCDPL